MGGKISFSAALVAGLLIASCLSPAPEMPAPRPQPLQEQLSSLPGDLRIVIWKSQYTLTMYKGSHPVRTYRAVFGLGFSDGDKKQQGDKRTPEGEFFICTKHHSKRFHKFLGLSYPGTRHAENGLRDGLISRRQYEMIVKADAERQPPPWDTKLGGAVGIHGSMMNTGVDPGFFIRSNWTDGCIALENAAVDELFSVVSLGTPVTILP